jgi:hypothetical protein
LSEFKKKGMSERVSVSEFILTPTKTKLIHYMSLQYLTSLITSCPTPKNLHIYTCDTLHLISVLQLHAHRDYDDYCLPATVGVLYLLKSLSL